MIVENGSDALKSSHLIELARVARSRIDPSNTMHALWDVIFDAEAWARGEKTALTGERDEVYTKLVGMFEQAK